ncbi:MAG: hypothetical protein IT290_03215 [Deltaproteobacteria bacterium]|nr:hypothetical protein [Deltaproteobacteria bacterium]
MPSPDPSSPRHDSTVGFADIKAVPDFSPEFLSGEMSVVIGILACAALAYLLLKRFRPGPQPLVVPAVTAGELLAQRKQRIEKLLSASSIDPRESGAEFSAFLRESLELKFGFPAAKLSSDEFAEAFGAVLSAKLRGVPAEQRTELATQARELLRRCERWAFSAPARGEPERTAANSITSPVAELRAAYEAINGLLRDTENVRSREESRTRTVVAHPPKSGQPA